MRILSIYPIQSTISKGSSIPKNLGGPLLMNFSKILFGSLSRLGTTTWAGWATLSITSMTWVWNCAKLSVCCWWDEAWASCDTRKAWRNHWNLSSNSGCSPTNGVLGGASSLNICQKKVTCVSSSPTLRTTLVLPDPTSLHISQHKSPHRILNFLMCFFL